MLFVVSRTVEGERTEWAAFADLATATECYEEAAYVVRNGPGDGPEDDPAIVTGACLYAADTQDPEVAKAMARDGRAVLLECE